MKVIILLDTLDSNNEGIAVCLAKEMGLHYNEI
jgi:hypothetical protein